MCTNAALGSFRSLLHVFNASSPEDFSDPRAFRDAALILEGITAGSMEVAGKAAAKASLREQRRAAERLTPLLRRGWKELEPEFRQGPFRPEDRREGGDAAWVESGLVPRPRALERLPDEALLAVGLFRLVEAVRGGAGALAVKRCASCRKLFLDRSRGLRARHCSNSCRSRTFREGPG